jgi:translation initiation factor 5
LLLDDKVVAQIKKFKRLFLRFTHENQKAQKYLMGGIEKTIESRKEELLPKVNSISNRF